MSSVRVNSEIVSHGENGFVAADEAEWVERLSELVLDHQLHSRIGDAGRQSVVGRSLVARRASTLATLITG